ncbi:unnamed protein product [Cylindrotheca closterium]|uniref:Multidrug and toxin extrusion protein n=1 Tax=Cylindrotheca closterium TaxID=2856 RepID=A0AAD2CFM2_9STRA|nr:unnamed protein product [Cylindrotheca closterium]
MFQSAEEEFLAQRSSVLAELWTFIELAIPTILVNLGMIASPMLCASFIGRKFDTVYLSGFALANLTGNLCTFSLLAGLFSASDTLGPQAFGNGNFKEVGLIAIRGLACATAILLPINIFLVNYLDNVLLALGQDRDAVELAVAWYRIFVWSFPFCVVYNVIWKFLSAQNIMRPMIVVSLVSFGIILPLGLEFLSERYGFLGSAWAYVNFQAIQAISLLAYIAVKQPHDHRTWPGMSTWRQAILAHKPMWEFMKLGIGGMLAQCEWVFWECASLVIGLLGTIPLSAHTIPSQVLMFLWLPPLSAGTALSIRMGITMTHSVRMTKKLIVSATVLIVLAGAVVNIFVYLQAKPIIQSFTNDVEVLATAEKMWWKMCTFSQLCSLFGALCGIATGLGMQWTLASINLVWLWVVGLPTLYYFTIVREGGLEAAWTCINLPYAGMDLSLLVTFACVNWEKVADEQQLKNTTDDLNENVTLLADPLSNIELTQHLE